MNNVDMSSKIVFEMLNHKSNTDMAYCIVGRAFIHGGATAPPLLLNFGQNHL